MSSTQATMDQAVPSTSVSRPPEVVARQNFVEVFMEVVLGHLDTTILAPIYSKHGCKNDYDLAAKVWTSVRGEKNAVLEKDLRDAVDTLPVDHRTRTYFLDKLITYDGACKGCAKGCPGLLRTAIFREKYILYQCIQYQRTISSERRESRTEKETEQDRVRMKEKGKKAVNNPGIKRASVRKEDVRKLLDIELPPKVPVEEGPCSFDPSIQGGDPCAYPVTWRMRVASEKRNYPFDQAAALEFVSQSIGKPCHICGGILTSYFSPDRVNNDAGYQADNIKPCCGRCNRSRALLSVETFIARAHRIATVQRYAPVRIEPIVTKSSTLKKRDAKFRKESTLTIEEVANLWTSRCYYCQMELACGIDRVDSSKNYDKGNCVPCCTTCNGMKSNMSDFIGFMKHVARLHPKTEATHPPLQKIDQVASGFDIIRFEGAEIGICVGTNRSKLQKCADFGHFEVERVEPFDLRRYQDLHERVDMERWEFIVQSLRYKMPRDVLPAVEQWASSSKKKKVCEE